MTHISVERRKALGIITIDRPQKRNAFTIDMLRDLARSLSELEADEAIAVTVVHAAGGDFTTGLDLADVAPSFRQGLAPFSDLESDPWEAIGRPRKKPLIAAVHGRCYTLGFELALAADCCIAARDSVFCLREVQLSLIPLGGGVVRMLEACGWSTTMRYVLTGDDMPAQEAHRLHLVQELVEPGGQLARALALAESIASRPPLAVRAAIAHAREALELGRRAAIAHAPARVRALLQTDDAREAIAALLEQRAPAFYGR